MAGTVAYIDGVSGDGSIINVSQANPLPVTAVSATIGVVTIADGADVAEGAKADAAVTDPTASASVIAALKGLLKNSGGFSFSHITTSTTTTVKNAAGVLRAVVVNTKGAVASLVIVKDNTSVIGIIDSLNEVGTFTFDVACATSIVVVTTGAPDVTVVYQ